MIRSFVIFSPQKYYLADEIKEKGWAEFVARMGNEKYVQDSDGKT
jgi:hypothetical protein